MKKSTQEKHKAGIDNATEIVICDTLDERTLRSWQVKQSIELPVNLSVLHALQCIERIKGFLPASIWVVPRFFSSL